MTTNLWHMYMHTVNSKGFASDLNKISHSLINVFDKKFIYSVAGGLNCCNPILTNFGWHTSKALILQCFIRMHWLGLDLDTGKLKIQTEFFFCFFFYSSSLQLHSLNVELNFTRWLDIGREPIRDCILIVIVEVYDYGLRNV